MSKGKIFSEETKRRISDAKKGTVCTKETRKKISESLSGKNNPRYGKESPRAKKVIYLGEIFNSLKAATKISGIPPSTLYKWIKYYPEKGWSYYDENITEKERQKLIELAKKDKLDKSKHRREAIKVVDSNGIIYDSISKAAEAIGISRDTLRNWLKNKPEKGWSYYTEN